MITPNTRIGRYLIESVLGVGGMGEVFLATDTELDRKVAIKCLSQEFNDDPERVRRFMQEAKSASALNHPNIITVYEIVKTGDSQFIAAEFIEGAPLSEKLKTENLSLESVFEIVTQIASALNAAHSAGIVHRDIKPDNVMVRPDGLVKILDFGIAKLSAPIAEARSTESEDNTAIQSHTTPGMIIGTANYMSPEQAKGQVVDARTDIFSLGVVLYEMIAGHLPFEGKTAMEMISSVLKDEPKPLTGSGVHPDMEAIIAKTLKKDRNERYGDTKELLDDLQNLRKRIEFEAELKRTTSPDQVNKEKTQILKAATHENTSATQTISNVNSIAVMPFTSMSSDEDNEYFCDGLAEELLNALSKIEDLKVAARTSAFSFKGKNANVSEIGEKLGVKNVLDGSVRVSGNRLRISVQLINASDGYQLWSERYDREMKDIFDVQDEITLAVVDALKLTLFGDEKAAVLKRGTENKEAYQLYLKGRYHFARRTMDDMQKGLDYFEQALELDPEYALAYVGIADIYNSWTKSLFLPAVEVIPKAKSAAKRALEIDPSLAEAHASLADSLAIFDWNWSEAECEFRRAIELNPNVSYTYLTYSIGYLVPMGRMDEAIAELKRAVELEPLSLIANSILSEVYLYARQNDKALEQARKAYDLNPNFITSRFWLGHALLACGMNEEAIALSEENLKSMPSNPVYLYLAGRTYAKSGRRKDAEQILKQIRESSKSQYVQPYSVARIFAALGENDKAFAELEKAFEQRDWWLPRLSVDPMMDSLSKDPRFNEMLQQIGLSPIETKQTDESLEAKTVMLKPEPPAVAGGLTQSSQEPDNKTATSNFNPQPSAAADGSDISNKPKSKWSLFGLLGLIVIAGGFFGYNYFASGSTQINSIAVLPFENNNGDADSDYLSDGLAESLIYRLSQLPNLKVSPTSSVFRYKGKETDPNIVAQELGVDSVLTGRITQRGDNLNISVNLVDTRNGKSLWGEKYERRMSELLATQTQITNEITNKLQLKLSGESEQKLAKKYTDNNEAYQLYLKGQYFWSKRTKDSTLKAIEQYKQAIAVDPSYALAYVGIANAYNSMGKDPHISPKEAIPQAKAAAKRALEIDPELAEANTALADSLAIYDWDWAESERRFKRSIELNPTASYTHLVYATSYLAAMKRPNEVVSEIERAVELEPLSLINNAVLVTGYLYARNNEKALEQGKKAHELDQNFLIGRFWLGLAYTANGRYDDAILLGEEGLKKTPLNPELLFIVGQAYAKSGRSREAEQYIEKMKEKQKSQYVRTYWIACIYSALGDKDKAFSELETSFKDKDIFLPRMRIDPAFDAIRDDKRFKDLLKRINLPE